MRTAFIQQLIKEAETNDKIFLIIGDIGYSVVEPFRDKFPDRFLNAGIAEQNMIGVAAGLAKEGYNVYVYSIANFPTLRCVEQIRNDVAYYKGNVKILAVGAGFAYASLGMSHHATEEIGIMRTLPNMMVASPSDPAEAQAIATFSANYEGCMYIRLGKAGEKPVFSAVEPLKPGHLHCLQESDSKNLLLVTGSILYSAVQQVRELGIDTAIYSVPFVKPLCAEQLCELAAKHTNIVVLEEHQKSCGVGSAVMEKLNEVYADGRLSVYPKVRSVAIKDEFIAVAGTQQHLREVAGLTLTKDLF
jgi:transketolase